MKKAPLYRKVNTTAHGVHHSAGGAFREVRHTEAVRRSEATHLSMHGKKHRGLDYTPLFKFLLSKVGSSWNEVHAEAVSRLDRPEPIFWLVALREAEEREYVRTGEASYFSGLRVDEQGMLQVVNPSLGPESLFPQCACCTHTFNGHRFTRPFDLTQRAGVSAYRVA